MSDSHRNPTVRTFYIYDGEDLELLDQLAEAVAVAQKAAAAGAVRAMSAADPVTEAVAAHNVALEEAKPRAQKVVLREVGKTKRRELLDKCPPREGNDADEVIGANADLLGDALLESCMASPTFDSADQREAFIESLGAKWYDKLTREAFAMNFGDAPVPKALSTPTPTSAAT